MKIQQSSLGSKNHQWISKNPSYSSVHKWLDKNFIKSKKCDHCYGGKFIEWALKKGRKHTHNRNNYKCLCSSCHKRYDYTPERRLKLSKIFKGRKITWGNKISKAQIGKKMSEESKIKMSVWHINHPPLRDKLTGKFKPYA